ncbi:MAG: sigma-70 family RNA polymerase sigma factor [Saprospiraceae bacterium]|nr:sigma-70 family RNA polymerase sigma factor [Saprospiraceae bacterium]
MYVKCLYNISALRQIICKHAKRTIFKGKIQKESGTEFPEAPAQNFGLKKDEFVAMTTSLKLGDEHLFERVFLSHFDDCIAYLVTNFKCDRETAYDITMDTLITFRSKLIHDKISYGNLRYLFTKMASQLYLKINLTESKLKNILMDVGVEEEYHEQRFNSLEAAWATLETEDKKLLQCYYYDDIALKDIAYQTNTNEATLRKKKTKSYRKTP